MSSNEPISRFLRACRRLPVDATPVWLMRQAGRYMEEYRALREKYSMLELIQTPELAADVTMQPINAFDLDAAIIFADILPPLIGMGLNLEFVPGKGPVIYNPIGNPNDIDQLRTYCEHRTGPARDSADWVCRCPLHAGILCHRGRWLQRLC